MLNSVGLVPPRAPCPMVLSVTLPVLVSVNVCVGPAAPRVTVPKLREVGVRPALTTATPVPVRGTGDPETVTLPVMVDDPVTAPAAVGANEIAMVHVLAAASVVPQVP